MENSINREEEIIRLAAERYGIEACELKKIEGGYQNLTFEYVSGDTPYMLRISKSSTRTFRQIESELQFLMHLSKYGVLVSLPVKSIRGNMIEKVICRETTYYAVSFRKAEGAHIRYPEFLSKHDVFFELGKITAGLHNASRTFPKELNNRIEWTDNYYLKSYKEFISEDETEKIASFEEQMNEVACIHRTKENFGLIHGDINVGNFFYNQGEITLFDFDECQNSWFVEDIAIQLFYTVYVYGDDCMEERNSKAMEFMQNFLKGYKSEADIDVEMLKQIPRFLLLREMIVHVGIYKKWDLESLSGWYEDYFRYSSERIRKRIPIVEYDPGWHDFS